MKMTTLIVAAALSFGSAALGYAQDSSDAVTLKAELNSGNYCHIKFPAIQETTLYTNSPALKSAASGDIIDFYGPCDENPTGPEQVESQIQDFQTQMDRNYGE